MRSCHVVKKFTIIAETTPRSLDLLIALSLRAQLQSKVREPTGFLEQGAPHLPGRSRFQDGLSGTWQCAGMP